MAYPTSLDSFTTHSAGQVIASADINAIQTAVVALERVVGLGANVGYLRSSSSIATFSPYEGFNSPALTSGMIFWSFFTAPISITATQIRYSVSTVNTGGSASQGWGVYSVDASDNLTLLSTCVGASVFASLGSNVGSLSASTALSAGSRYAVGVFFSGGTGTPAVACQGISGTSLGAEWFVAPRMAAIRAGQSAHASTVVGNLSAPATSTGLCPYAVLL